MHFYMLTVPHNCAVPNIVQLNPTRRWVCTRIAAVSIRLISLENFLSPVITLFVLIVLIVLPVAGGYV